MERYEPYYADDTDGVHFQVCVDGCYVQAHVGRTVLARRYGVVIDTPGCVAAYLAHKTELDEAVVRRVRLEGPETVVLQLAELVDAAGP